MGLSGLWFFSYLAIVRLFGLFESILRPKSWLFTAEVVNLSCVFPSICIRISPVCQKLYC